MQIFSFRMRSLRRRARIQLDSENFCFFLDGVRQDVSAHQLIELLNKEIIDRQDLAQWTLRLCTQKGESRDFLARSNKAIQALMSIRGRLEGLKSLRRGAFT